MTAADVDPTPTDMVGLIDFLQAKAAQDGDTPTALMEGTFALYPTPDGGLMMVAAVPTGPMEGVHHYRMNPAIMKGMAMLFGGKMGAIKGMFKKKPKEVGGGR
jgi:hypothetical protein